MVTEPIIFEASKSRNKHEVILKSIKEEWQYSSKETSLSDMWRPINKDGLNVFLYGPVGGWWSHHTAHTETELEQTPTTRKSLRR